MVGIWSLELDLEMRLADDKQAQKKWKKRGKKTPHGWGKSFVSVKKSYSREDEYAVLYLTRAES